MCRKCFVLLELLLRAIFEKYPLPRDIETLLRETYLGEPGYVDGWERCWGDLFINGDWQTCWHALEPEYVETYDVLMADGTYVPFTGDAIYQCFGSGCQGHFND